MVRDVNQIADNTSAVMDANVLQRVAHGQAKLAQDSSQADTKPSVNGATSEETQYTILLPPFDTATHRLSQVFPISGIITPGLATALAAEASKLSEANDATRQNWASQGTYPGFILSRLAYLPIDNLEAVSLSATKRKRKSSSGANEMEKPVTRMEMATNLALLAHLFRLYKLRPRDLQQKMPLPHSPLPVARHLLNEFTSYTAKEGMERTKVRTMTPTLRDKLIYHMIVLILHCDRFSTTIDGLPVDFKLSSERIKKYFAFISCSFSKQEVKDSGGSNSSLAADGAKQHHTVARLVAPLVFKTTRSFRR